MSPGLGEMAPLGNRDTEVSAEPEPTGRSALRMWWGRRRFRYIVSGMSMSSLEPDDVRAAAELHRELDPEYRDALVESFLDRVGKEIDAQVDRRLAAQPAPQPRTMALAIVSVAVGIPLTGIIMSLSDSGQLAELAVIWVMIAVINVAYALGHRLPPRR